MAGFLTAGFSLVGQENLNNDGGVVGPDNTPVVNDKVTSFTSPGTFSGADPKNSGQTGKVIIIGVEIARLSCTKRLIKSGFDVSIF